jgi:hypothetical protein
MDDITLLHWLRDVQKAHHVAAATQAQLTVWLMQAAFMTQSSSLLLYRESRMSGAALTPRVDLSTWEESDCITKFRFSLPEIVHITHLMGFPSSITVNRVIVPAETAMAMVMRRLAYPARLSDIAPEFGLDVSSTGRIINYMLEQIMDRYGTHIHLWPGLTPSRVSRYAAAITSLEPAVIDIWGFIDGTFRDICKPEVHQRASYSGYERGHGQKYQGVLCPDGLIVSMQGPFVGSKNDLGMLQDSGLQGDLLPIVTQADGRQLQLYGDRAYRGQPIIMCPFSRVNATEAELAYNKCMSGQRVSVETAFGKVTQYFAMTDLRRNMRSGLQPTAAYYLVSTLFTNIHTCMHGSNVPWMIAPPSVEDYLDSS